VSNKHCNTRFTMRMLACIVSLTAIAVADDPIESSVDNPLYTSSVLDKLEAKIDTLGKETVARMVPTLIKLLERREPTLDWRILQLMTKADLTAISEPQPVVEAVLRLLNDPEQATRALAVDVLCGIGEPAKAALVTCLKSPSPRVRAASAVVLMRQGMLAESDAIEISRDTDARVRVATINALGKTHEGIDVLIAMLSDEESALACCAAERLGRLPEKNDSEKIVHALANALTRPQVGGFAASSLARMGSDARSAIPKLLAAYPVGRTDSIYSDDMVESALVRIGEPREEDIAEILDSLENGVVERRILVCQTLARLGTKAKSTSVILEKLMRLDLERDKKQSEELARRSAQHQRFIIASDAALSAYWFTTRDALAFRSLAEEWPEKLWLGNDFWEALSDVEKAELTTCFLQSSKSAVVAEALIAIAGSSPMPMLEPKMQSLMHANAIEDRELLANAWLNTLIPTQANVEDRILAALEGKSISIEQFARNAKRLNCGSERSLRVLFDGAKNLEKFSAQECGQAYLQLASNRVQAIENIRRQSDLGFDWLMQVIANEKWDAPELATIAEAAIRGTDNWTRVSGIKILGNIGPSTSKISSEIKSLFEEAIKDNEREISDIALAAAVALFKIDGDTSFVDKLLERIAQLEARDKLNATHYDYKRQDVLEEIIAPGSKYTDIVVKRLNEYDPLRVEEIDDSLDIEDVWIRLALRTGSRKARDCVVNFSNSKDALLSRLAKERLRNEN
jgi:hypothetical protein